MHKEEGLSFANVTTFNLDEYFPMDPSALQSYHRFMHENLFDLVDIDKERVHIPDASDPAEGIRWVFWIEHAWKGVKKHNTSHHG